VVSTLDSIRVINLLLPFISTAAEDSSNCGDPKDPSKQHTRILALHTLSPAVRNLSSPDLLLLLPTIVPVILPHFSSALVDIRKSVVFVMVEMYLIVGDSLHPYVMGLAPPQRKLLTVYIERQMNRSTFAPTSTPSYDM
jgi:hypothetical protein